MAKKIYRLIIFACLYIFLFSLYGCSSKKEEPTGTSFWKLLNRIGEISEVNEDAIYFKGGEVVAIVEVPSA